MNMLPSLLVSLIWLALPAVASAHAFGEQPALPLPTGFYILGGTAAFVVSCALLMFIKGREREARSYSLTIPPGLWKVLSLSLKILFVGIFIFGIYQGFAGEQVDENILIALFWVGLVLVVPYVSALISGWWDIANPFKTIASFLPGGKATTRLWEGEHFPALVGYGVFIIFELFLQNISVTPYIVASVLIGYVLYVWLGSLRWGSSWLVHADFFALFFNLAGKLSPLRIEKGRVILASLVHRLIN